MISGDLLYIPQKEKKKKAVIHTKIWISTKACGKANT